MIHVAFGSSNLYAKFAGTAMLSMFKNFPLPYELRRFTNYCSLFA